MRKGISKTMNETMKNQNMSATAANAPAAFSFLGKSAPEKKMVGSNFSLDSFTGLCYSLRHDD